MGHRLSVLCLGLAVLASCARSSDAPARSAREAPAESLPALIERVQAAVVNVDVLARKRKGPASLQAATGSGFFIDESGLLLTNAHLVENALVLRIRTPKGEAFEGSVVGLDRLTDLAVVRTKGRKSGFPFAALGDSESVRVGEAVVAIGNPYGLASTVTQGIISARARETIVGAYDEFLQTDAAINPGNSGGPLFNMKGEVIGINTVTVRNANIGFAVPINLAKALLPQLKEKGRVRRGWLGVTLDDVSADLALALKVPGERGALVTAVSKESPAAKSGISSGEVLLAVNHQPTSSSSAVRRALGMLPPQTPVQLVLFKKGQKRELTVKLDDNPDDDDHDAPRPLASDDSEKERHLGLTLQEGKGGSVEIALVTPNSAADRAGLMPGMKIKDIDEKPVKRVTDALTMLRAAAPDSVVVLRMSDANANVTLKALRIPPAS